MLLLARSWAGAKAAAERHGAERHDMAMSIKQCFLNACSGARFQLAVAADFPFCSLTLWPSRFTFWVVHESREVFHDQPRRPAAVRLAHARGGDDTPVWDQVFLPAVLANCQRADQIRLPPATAAGLAEQAPCKQRDVSWQ